MTTIVSSSGNAVRSQAFGDGAAAFAGALLFLCFHAAQGFPTLGLSDGDNDSLMRLVQVRDLLAGQNWFDLTQYRMGPPGGFAMHWSRLVDAPIALLILAAKTAAVSQPAAEVFALVAWPTLLFGASLRLMLHLARRLGGEWAALPALVIGCAALHFTGIFAPGAIDHHNVQLTLALAAVAGLAAGRNAAALAGMASALMLAIGMEAAPYVAVAGASAAALLLSGGEAERRSAGLFGATFAATAGLLLVATVAPRQWTGVACDAYSGAHFVIAAASGGGLVLIAALRGLVATAARRAGAMAALAVLISALVLVLVPHCLAGPYAGLDPRLRIYWIDHITEVQGFVNLLRVSPQMAVAYYATPLIALVVLALEIRRGDASRTALVLGAFLAAAFMVSLWQVRGSMFAIPFAAVPLSAWVARARAVAATGARGAALKMVLTWLVSINMIWAGGAAYLADALGMPSLNANAGDDGPCYAEADFGALAAMPATTVLAVSNLGASILRFTHHRALAGPYHRNVTGNLLALDALMGQPDIGPAGLRANGVTLLAHCRGNPESDALAGWAPGGLMAAILAGRVPAWLEPLPGGNHLTLYRLRPAG